MIVPFGSLLAPTICALFLGMVVPSFATEIRLAKHVSAEIIAQETSIQPGRPFRVAVRLRIDSSWHVYWRNAGDAGMPTRINWRLPKGFTADEIEWPYPHLTGDPPEVSYAYEGEVLLAARITPPATLEFGSTIGIEATVSLLACQDVCIPGKGELSTTIPVRASNPQPDPQWTAAFARTEAMLPRSIQGWWHADAVRNADGIQLRISPEFKPTRLPTDVQFFAADEGVIDHSTQQSASAQGVGMTIDLPASAFPDVEIDRLRGVLFAADGWNDAGTIHAIWIDVPLPKPD